MDNNKTRFTRVLEIVTNLSIIAVALVGTTVLVKNYLLRPHSPVASEASKPAADKNLIVAENPRPRTVPPGPAAGTQFTLPGIAWNDSDETVVLALSDKCHYCTESAPFYQRLTRELADRKNVRVMAVFPQEVDAGKKYLAGLNVPIAQVSQATLDSLGVRGTPTLVIVDRSGKVKQAWVGRLTPERETEVLSRVRT